MLVKSEMCWILRLDVWERETVLSRARRDEESQLLGRSALLLQVQADEDYLPRNRVPLHAFS